MAFQLHACSSLHQSVPELCTDSVMAGNMQLCILCEATSAHMHDGRKCRLHFDACRQSRPMQSPAEQHEGCWEAAARSGRLQRLSLGICQVHSSHARHRKAQADSRVTACRQKGLGRASQSSRKPAKKQQPVANDRPLQTVSLYARVKLTDFKLKLSTSRHQLTIVCLLAGTEARAEPSRAAGGLSRSSSQW